MLLIALRLIFIYLCLHFMVVFTLSKGRKRKGEQCGRYQSTSQWHVSMWILHVGLGQGLMGLGGPKDPSGVGVGVSKGADHYFFWWTNLSVSVFCLNFLLLSGFTGKNNGVSIKQVHIVKVAYGHFSIYIIYINIIIKIDKKT